MSIYIFENVSSHISYFHSLQGVGCDSETQLQVVTLVVLSVVTALAVDLNAAVQRSSICNSDCRYF